MDNDQQEKTSPWVALRYGAVIVVAFLAAQMFMGGHHKTTGVVLDPPIKDAKPQPELLHEAPHIAFTTLKGNKPASLKDLRGKVVIVNFWAPWCSVCREEVGPFSRLSKSLPEGAAAVLIAVDYQSPDEVRSLLGKSGLDIWLDAGGEVFSTWQVSSLPSAFMVDAQGIIRKKMIGRYDWSGPQIKQDVEKVLALGR